MAKAKKSGKKGLTITEEILRHRLMPIEEFESMTVEAAKLLAASSSYEIYSFGSLEWIKTLSDEVARELCKSKKWHSMDLSGLASISDSVAEILSKLKGDLTLDGLTSISDRAATSLGKISGKHELSLNGITTLSDKAASALSKHGGEGSLNLAGLTELSDQTAKALSKHKGGLGLSGLTELSNEAAEALSKHKGGICLLYLESISDAAALSLSKNKSIKVSEQITQKIGKAVKKYATASSSITSKDQAKIRELIKTEDPNNVNSACNLLEALNASEGDWLKLFPKTRINGLLAKWDTKIWNILATAMKPHDRVYELLKEQASKRVKTDSCDYAVRNRIDEFLDRLVKVANDDCIDLLALAHPRVGVIICYCVENLPEPSDRIIELISNHKGGLDLEAHKLSDKVVQALSKVEGNLDLDGLTELSDQTAKALSKHKGDLVLSGLTELSDEAAKTLSKHKGNLYLNGLNLKGLSAKAAKALAGHQGDLGLSCEGSLSDKASAALAQKKGTINQEDPKDFVDGLGGE